MRKFIHIVGCIAVMSLLASCTGDNRNQSAGTLIGAGLGGLLGSQIGSGDGQLAATAIGVLAGAYIGGQIGQRLDEVDRQKMRETTQTALETAPSGQTSSWVNPDSGNQGTVTPQPAFQNEAEEHCREYQQTVTVGGETKTAYGTACRQPDGTWRISNS